MIRSSSSILNKFHMITQHFLILTIKSFKQKHFQDYIFFKNCMEVIKNIYLPIYHYACQRVLHILQLFICLCMHVSECLWKKRAFIDIMQVPSVILFFNTVSHNQLLSPTCLGWMTSDLK